MRKPVPMFSLREAAARGIERVYQPNWVGTLDHVKLDLARDGTFGPWLHFYSPMNQVINGRDPVDLLVIEVSDGMRIDLDAQCLYAYAGPLPDSDEYKAEAAEFAAMVKRTNQE